MKIWRLLVMGALFFAWAGLPAEGAQPAGKYPAGPITFLVPFGPGGGMDTTARNAAQALAQEKIISVAMPVENRAGGGGSVGLAYVVQNKKRDNHTVLFHSPGILLYKLEGQSQFGFMDVVPIARLNADYNFLTVRKDSPFKTATDLMNALKANPGSLVVAGTSAPGGPDHLSFMVTARAAGVEIKKVRYLSFTGAGELMTALLGGSVQVISCGVNDIAGQLEAGTIRSLGVVAPQRYADALFKNIPTMKEQGINVTFDLFRGAFGPPGMSDEARDYLAKAFGKMAETSPWKNACAKYQWQNFYAPADQWKKYLEEQTLSLGSLLKEMGLTKK